jgi:hypothetical protein
MPRRDLALGIARLGFSALGVVAMTYQFAVGKANNSLDTGNFFSFFTIQTNILAAAMLALVALVRPGERPAAFDAVRGAVTLYIAITGVVFALLLSGHAEDLNTSVAWVDFVVHKLIPVVLVVDWLVDPPRHRLRVWVGVAWLAYPAAWFAYTLIRGASTDWYPYPFVDRAEHGYPRVLGNAVILGVAFLAAAMVFVLVGNRRPKVPRGTTASR